MKKTLLIDTNRAAVPIYHSLIKKKHQVWVVGKNPNETLAKISDHYVQLDYSDIAALKNLIAIEQFDYIVPGCTDLSYQICAEIGQGNLPGVETVENTETINNKKSFHTLCNHLAIPVPQTLTAKQALSYPAVIVKPVDSFSGHGITMITNPTEETLKQAHTDAAQKSLSNHIIIQEYITGQLYSYSAFIENQSVMVDFFVQEDATTHPFTVDTSCVVTDFCTKTHKKLQLAIEKIARELDLLNGLVHTQFILNGEQFWIIEMTRRCPGDIYSLLIEFSTGYSYAENYVASFLNENIQPWTSQKVIDRIIRHTITSKETELFWGLQFSEKVKIKLFVPLATSGDEIKPSPHGRVGIFFLQTNSSTEQNILYQKLLARKLYTLDYQF